MWEIWKSWSVNPAVFRERMDAAMRSIRETTVENVVTRTRVDVDTNVVNRVVDDLNAQGYNYRVAPLGELVW